MIDRVGNRKRNANRCNGTEEKSKIRQGNQKGKKKKKENEKWEEGKG